MGATPVKDRTRDGAKNRVRETAGEKGVDPWRGFHGGLWQKRIDERDFIQQNYEPYEGDGAFLAPATKRTENLWRKLQEMFVEERKKGRRVADPRLHHVASPRLHRSGARNPPPGSPIE